ncbi:MAG: hypothetical protein LBI53_01965 [Candidatus Peribacteria bacterium]|nr:hypothetical protein [Candidatus Peribacteria bacterium]
MSSTRWSCWLRYGHKSSDSFFVGVVNPDTGKLNNTDRSYVPLWSPVNGKIFNIKSNADKWKLN